MTFKKHNNSKGFVALISTMLLMMGIFVYAVVVSSAAFVYADMANRKVMRSQIRQNLGLCLQAAGAMLGRDYFLIGTTTIRQFGCTVTIDNDFSGHASISAISEMSGIREYGTL